MLGQASAIKVCNQVSECPSLSKLAGLFLSMHFCFSAFLTPNWYRLISFALIAQW